MSPTDMRALVRKLNDSVGMWTNNLSDGFGPSQSLALNVHLAAALIKDLHWVITDQTPSSRRPAK
jgi:hypothetical protein